MIYNKKIFLLVNPINTTITVTLITLKNKILGKIQWQARKNLSEDFLPRLEELFCKTHITIQELCGIVALIGPGSYTNTRVVLTAINLFSYVLKLPQRGISLFDLELYSFLHEKNFPRNQKKYRVRVVFHSPYGECSQSYEILRNKKLYITKIQKVGKFCDVKQYPTKYHQGVLLFESSVTCKKKISLQKQFENFAQELLWSDTIYSKDWENQTMLFPCYYAPPLITKRKNNLKNNKVSSM